MLRFIISTVLFIFVAFQLVAEENVSGVRPPFLSIITNIPQDFKDYGKTFFTKKYLPMWGSVVATTAVTYYYDDKIIHAVQKRGRKIFPDSEDRKYIPFKIAGLPIQLPDNANGLFYYIGDGLTQGLLNASFYAYGYWKKDLRAQITAMEITEGLIGMTIVTQGLKHMTGRQSPKRSTHPRGRWKWFPSPKEYSSHVPSYDAYPSGHFATFMTTMTIIAENYEEYTWIRPTTYGLLTLLGLAMLNNGVHWTSDYPLAIALGYGWGKVIADRGKARINLGERSTWWERSMILPIVGPQGIGAQLTWTTE